MTSSNKYLSAVKKLCKNPWLIFPYAGSLNLLNWMPDSWYLKGCFRAHMGYKLNLKNPQTFNEKLQWLKIHDRNPAYTQMVDKYLVRDYIKKNIGEKYLIPLLGVWDSFDEIDFDALPNQFVLKTNHDSGGVVICKDKNSFDMAAARKKLNKHLRHNAYYTCREWPYKNVPHKIIAEQYMADSKKSDNLTDYKFFCTAGTVDNVMLCLERNTGETKFYFFNNNWDLLRYNIRGKNAPADFTLPKPDSMDEMFSLASKLSRDIPFVRVDFYSVDNRPYFGELTFFPAAGFDPNLLRKTDEYFGSLIKLPSME